MKKELLKSVLLIVCLLISITASAYDFENGGICYNITSQKDKTVEVSGEGLGSYGASAVVIPASVKNGGTAYSVTSIGKEAFIGCIGLTSVTMPNSVTEIGMGAFVACSELTSITIPNSVTEIGEGAFRYCSGLKKFIVDSGNNNYTVIDGVLFNKDETTIVAYPNAKSPKYTIPNSVTKIGEEAFNNYKSLTSVTIPNSVTEIGEKAFEGCEGLTSITIPNSVTKIGRGAFLFCEGLKSIAIPNSVTEIGDAAFCYCSGLTSITIPNSVTEIGPHAFYDCKGLIEIYNYSESPQSISESVFNKVDKKTCILYVPKGTVKAYRASDCWKEFLKIKEFTP